jgi:glycosyltransferase involved in cell wall biosynthesis
MGEPDLAPAGDLPKITLITVTLNNEETIGDTVRSVAEQGYPNLEYIVIDGKSTDGTLDRLRPYQSVITTLVSEPDHGIYDAMNKGIDLAKGEIIGFLNADDFYDTAVLHRVAEAFRDPSLEACFGDLYYVDKHNTRSILRYWRSSPFHPGAFERGWNPAHSTFFVRRSVYERFGGFDLSYKIAADIELMMRFLEVHRISSRYLPGIMLRMRAGGTSNRSIGSIIQQNREVLSALSRHGLKASAWRLLSSKVVSRTLQFVIRPKREH